MGGFYLDEMHICQLFCSLSLVYKYQYQYD